MKKMCSLVVIMFTIAYSLSPIPLLRAGNSWHYYHCQHNNSLLATRKKFIGKTIITIDSILIHDDSTFVFTKTLNNGTCIFEYDTVNDTSWSSTVQYLFTPNEIFTKNEYGIDIDEGPFFMYGYNKDNIQYKVKYKDRILNLNSYCSDLSGKSETSKYLDSIGLIYQTTKILFNQTNVDEIFALINVNGINFDSTSIIEVDSSLSNFFKIKKNESNKEENDAIFYLLNGRKLSQSKKINPNLLNIHLKLISEINLRP